MSGNGKTCNGKWYIIKSQLSALDISECGINNGNCEQQCNNEVGSYSCSCNTGYTLASNQRDCNGM